MYVSVDGKGAIFSPPREHALLPASSGLSFVLFSPKWGFSCNCFLACCMLQVDSAEEKKKKVEGSRNIFTRDERQSKCQWKEDIMTDGYDSLILRFLID